MAGQIEAWRNQPITGQHAYVFLDGIWLKRSWGGEVKNISILVAIGVNADGYREILGVAEGTNEDKPSWQNFLRHLKDRGLKAVKFFIADKCLGLVESLGEFYPEAAYQRCAVHFAMSGPRCPPPRSGQSGRHAQGHTRQRGPGGRSAPRRSKSSPSSTR